MSTPSQYGDTPNQRRADVWEIVSHSPVHSLWDLQGVSPLVIAKRTWKAALEDNLLGRAAQLGFYFLFSLFPTLFSASSILGLAARSSQKIYTTLLQYLALVMPTAALGSVLEIFQETAGTSSSGKFTFGLIAAIWSASAGISALQDTLNAVYKVKETRSYFRARGAAIGLTIALIVTMSLALTCMLGADFCAAMTRLSVSNLLLRYTFVIAIRVLGWTLAASFLALSFSLIYYWAPCVKRRRWRWLTPGSAISIIGWLVASLGLRIYLHFFNNYSVTYGSLGAVIILLTWFYLTGFVILLGAEINSEIEAAVTEQRLKTSKPFPAANTPVSSKP